MILNLLSGFLRMLPLAWALALGRGVGVLLAWFFPLRRDVALANMDRVYGDTLDASQKRRLLFKVYQQLGMYGVETLRLPSLTAKQAYARIDHPDLKQAMVPVNEGKGLIVVVAHVGNFDLLACVHGLWGVPLAVVYKDISWKAARKFWEKIRARTGIAIIPPRRAKEEIHARLKLGQVVAFAIDQHMAAHRGIVCDFFGHPASTTPAPVRFAMDTGVLIQPVVMFRDGVGGRHRLHHLPQVSMERPHADVEANVQHNTERLNRIVEGWIRKAPEQWLWMHRRWKNQPEVLSDLATTGSKRSAKLFEADATQG